MIHSGGGEYGPPREPIAWVKDERAFKEQLERGRKYLIIFAQMLCSAGVEKSHISIGRHEFRRGYSDRHRFRNEKDIDVRGRRLEVKSRNIKFCGPYDYPMKTAFVDTVAKWESRNPEPFALVLVSQYPPWGVAVVFPSTRGEWTIVKRYDRIRGYDEKFWQVDKRLLGSMADLVTALNS